jgi:hypothetical protein
MTAGRDPTLAARLAKGISPVGSINRARWPSEVAAEKHALKRTVVVNERKQLRLHANTSPPGAITSGNTIHSVMVRFLLDATANVDYLVRGCISARFEVFGEHERQGLRRRTC